MLATYANLAALKLRNNIPLATTTGDVRFLEKLAVATRGVTEYCHRSFVPRIAVRRFDYAEDTYLFFNYHDLLELTSLESDGNAMLTGSPDVTLLNWEGDGIGPYFALETINQYFLYSLTKSRVNKVTGVWGWHSDYANAFIDTKLTATIADSTGVTWTTSADPTVTADADATVPALSAGDLVKCGTEYAIVSATSPSGFTATRGAQGSTAAAHAGIPLYRWKVPADIREATLTWAAYLLIRDDFDDSSVRTDPNGSKTYPPGFPERICSLLDPYVNVRVS